MDMRFTDHAVRQLAERNITESEVAKAILAPDKTIKQSANRFRAVKKIRKRHKVYLLIVIYEMRGIRKEKEIVTAFLTSKWEKYL